MDPDLNLEPGLRIISIDEDVAVASFRNLVLVQFRGQTPAACVSIVRRAFEPMIKAGQKAVFFGVIETTSTPPNEAARAAFTKMFDDLGEHIAVALVTIRGDGFRTAMVRVIASGILNFVRFRVRFPKHIGGSLDEAADRASEKAIGADASAILRSFRQLAKMTP